MADDRTDLRIGELLIESQILQTRDLHDAIKIAKLTGLPLGRVLIMSSYLSEKDFQAAVKAQSLVRDSILPLSAAIQILTLMSRSRFTFEEAMNELGWAGAREATTNKLGEMLLESEIVSQEQLERAIKSSQSTGLPLGRVLVSLGVLSDETLTTALNTQILIRDRRVTREQGIRGLKAAYERRLPLELTLQEKGYYRGPIKPSVRLGELFVETGLITPIQVMDALERGLSEEKPIGQALIDMSLIDERLLDGALTLQEMVANRTLTLTLDQAAFCLKHLSETDLSLNYIVSHLEVDEADFKVNLRLHDLLRVAGVLQHSDIELSDIKKGEKPTTADAVESVEKLLHNEFINEAMYLAALRCYFLVVSGWMSVQQGIIALNYFSHYQEKTFDDILLKLDWTVRTRPVFFSQERFEKGLEHSG